MTRSVNERDIPLLRMGAKKVLRGKGSVSGCLRKRLIRKSVRREELL